MLSGEALKEGRGEKSYKTFPGMGRSDSGGRDPA
jgi:hypothetical protein